MNCLNTPCTVANDQPEVTADSIMEAVKEFKRLQAEREQHRERYVFDPEVLQRIKSEFSIYRPMPLTLDWKK